MAVAGYEYRVNGGSPVDAGNVLLASVTGLTSDTSYNFEVRSYDLAGNRSAWSPVVAASTLPTFRVADIMDVEPNAFGLTDGTSIVSLDNSVIGQNDGTQSTSGDRAVFHTNQQGGKGAAQLDGVNDFYDFGNIFNSLTQGSFYFLGRKTNDPAGVLQSGSWQTDASGDTSLLGLWSGASNGIDEKLFTTVRHNVGPIGEPSLSDKYFLYEVHASGTSWEMILNSTSLFITNANTFQANVGFLFGDSFGAFYEGFLLRMLCYSTAHNQASRIAVRKNLQARYSGDLLDHYTTNIVFVGDSITYSFPYSYSSLPDAPYPYRTLVNLDSGVPGTSNYLQSRVVSPSEVQVVSHPHNRRSRYFGNNRGRGGYTTTDLESEAADTDAFLDSNAESNILVVLIGSNDFPVLSSSVPTVHAAIGSYCQDRRDAGWTVYVGTIFRRTDYGAGITNADALNPLIRANYTSYADGLIDFAADSRFDDPNDTTYFETIGGVHPNATGYQIMGDIAAAALSA